MGFSVPPRLRLERWALTPPFHPCPALSKTVRPATRWPRAPVGRFQKERGGFIFCGTVRRPASRRGRPRVLFGRQSETAPEITRHRALWCSDFPPPPRKRETEATLRPSKIKINIADGLWMTIQLFRILKGFRPPAQPWVGAGGKGGPDPTLGRVAKTILNPERRLVLCVLLVPSPLLPGPTARLIPAQAGGLVSARNHPSAESAPHNSPFRILKGFRPH